jgi:hypothetical protein
MTMNYNVYSQNNFSYSLGDFGVGNNFTNNETNNFEVNFSLVNLFFEYPGYLKISKARIGIKMSPFNLRNLPLIDNRTFSFVNIDIFTDFLGPIKGFLDNIDYIIFGPFASINWLLFEKEHFEPEYFIFNTGLRFTLLGYIESNARVQIVDCDVGYRRINEINSLYFTIKFDLFDFIALPIILGALPTMLGRIIGN